MKEQLEIETNEQNYNKFLSEGLSDLKHASGEDETEQAMDILEEIFGKIGTELDPATHSLVTKISTKELPEDLKQKFGNWGIEYDNSESILVSLNLPKRESTGTHGSGERQKMIEAIETIAVDYDAEENPILKINLFGKFTGLFHKLVDALTVELKPDWIESIEISNNPKWKEILSSSANSILESPISKRWPEFVKQQVSELQNFEE